MSKQSTESIILPSKFLALTLHLLIITMSYFSYPDNILAAYPSLNSQSDPLYTGGRVSFLACNTLSLIFLLVEMVVLFAGTNMFRDRVNFLNASLHMVGAILWSSFVFQQWQFTQLWALWAVFSLLPLAIEIVSIVSVSNK